MNYQPRHPQPFTIAQALQLDAGTIVNEITRLENSLLHLNRTQNEIREHISASEPSADDHYLLEALTENDAVIASQKERISMLKLVLQEKGASTSNTHYDMPEITAPEISRAQEVRLQSLDAIDVPNRDAEGSSDIIDGGVYL